MAAHNNEVLTELPNYISIVQKLLPNVSFMVNSDHVNMTEILPGFLQHVTIPTRWTVFIPTNKMPTEPSLAPPRGLSKNISIILVATYVLCWPASGLHKRPSLWGPVVPSLPCRAASSDRLAGPQGVSCLWVGGGFWRNTYIHLQVHWGCRLHQDCFPAPQI